MPVQHAKPRMSGLPPDLMSFTMSVLRPIAAMARTIKKRLSSFTGANTDASIPTAEAAVVMIDAHIKYSINVGNIALMLTDAPSPPDCFARRVRRNASASVIGIIASVLVSFTVTAVSSVAEPRLHMLSHVDAAAVTDDVSFTAVPANIPNGSPETVEKPMI